MTSRYVHHAATGANDGTTEANAFTASAGAAAVDTAGDIIYYSDAHSESTASALTLAFAGDTKLICGSFDAEPPTTPGTTALIATLPKKLLEARGLDRLSDA